MPPRRRHGYLQDEQGDFSASRLLLTVVVPVALGLIIADSLVAWIHVDDMAYDTLKVISVALISWAGGRAGMRYVGDALKGRRGVTEEEDS